MHTYDRLGVFLEPLSLTPLGNNLDYLKLCIKSIRQNSKFKHELIIHVNEGTDGSLDFVKESGLKYTYSEYNTGVCVAFNQASKISSNKYLVLAHDDMYFCPNWDEILKNEIPIQTHEIPTGEKVFDWTIPKEWNINNAYIIDPDGKKIVDFKESNLHVVNYSIPINQKISFSESQSQPVVG